MIYCSNILEYFEKLVLTNKGGFPIEKETQISLFILVSISTGNPPYVLYLAVEYTVGEKRIEQNAIYEVKLP